MQELRADAVVEADAARHVLHVRAGLLAQVGDLVDEGDLGGEEGVGRVLDELGRAPAGEQQGVAVEIERAVDVGQHRAGALVVGADHDAVRELEVADGRTLAQELRIGDDGEVGVGPRLGDDARHLVAGADGDGRLGDDHLVAVEHVGDLAGGLEDVGEVGVAVAAARGRADGDEDRLGGLGGLHQAGREEQPLLAHVLGNELREARLEDRHLAAGECGDLVGVLVDAGHDVAEVGKAGARDEAYVPGADHCYAHVYLISKDCVPDARSL